MTNTENSPLNSPEMQDEMHHSDTCCGGHHHHEETEENLENDTRGATENTPPPPQENETDWEDKALRLVAEMDNLRKRTARDIADARKFALTSFARDIIGVQDVMQRALKATQEKDVPLEKIQEGFTMVSEKLAQTLERFQVKKFSAMGEKLDPQKHQVITEIVDEAAEEGTVIQEMQEGYTISDRLLRPAMVITAKKE